MESQNKRVKSVKELEKVSKDMSIIDIEFYDNSIAKYVSSYSSALSFIDKDVIVELRDDIFKGQVCKYISQLTMTSVTTTLTKEQDLKLYSEETGEIFSTIAFEDIPDSGVMGAILFCTNVQYQKSDKSTWFKFTCLDRNRKSCNVRLFDPIRDTANFIGRYLSMDIRKGNIDYIARKVSIQPGIAPEANPEIRIAKAFIFDVVKEYEDIVNFLNTSQILDYVEKYNLEEDIEPGYEMVRLAIELEQIRNLKNVTKEVDIHAMMKKVLLDRGYCISDNETTVKSKALQNIYEAIKLNAIDSKMVMHLIDPDTKLNTAEINLIKDFRSIANTIAKVNRTYFFDRIK